MLTLTAASALPDRPQNQAPDLTPDEQFSALAGDYIKEQLRRNPAWATELGIHAYDGQLSDLSEKAMRGRAETLRRYLTSFEHLDPLRLAEASRLDYNLVVNDIRANLLELEEIQLWRKNPDLYSSHVTASIHSLIKRDFAPLEQRLKTVISREKQVKDVLKAARANLKNPPRIYTEIALEQMPGITSFFAVELPKAFVKVKDQKLLRQFKETNGRTVKELKDYELFLKSQLLPRSNGRFALGPELFAKKLLYEEMIDEPIDALLAWGERELVRLKEEFVSTARRIDSRRSPAQVFASISADHPRPAELISSVRGVLESLRNFCLNNGIVTIPSPERARVDETPPFMRALSFASMDTPGPFEEKAQEAYYFVTLPDPKWPKKKVEEHMRAFCRLDLVNTSAHEAYPGHYVQFLWVQKAPSKVRKVFGCDSNAEGWAHYCEEMMLEQGLGKGDLKLRLVQLHDALLRACRYVAGIRMHTRGASMAEAVRLFMEDGYQEKANAEREAKRGTIDATYLVYTLGKREIVKLREDYRRAQGDKFKLRDFHDRFLAQGFPPLKLVRAALLGIPSESPGLALPGSGAGSAR